ncbi:MAG: site-specific integrase [Defluviitaleaceae bacterium]|nr:site-specific integrase [Defluviitaleaceae bacterium]
MMKQRIPPSKPERVFNVEGCEYKGNNKYKMVVSSGFNAQGKRDRRSQTVTATSKRELEDMYAKFKTEVRTGLFLNNINLTFRQFIETQWLVDTETKSLAPKTLSRYEIMLYQRILPHIGHIKISDINRNHIIKLYDSMLQDGARFDGKSGGLSGKTVLHHHRLLSKIFNTAVLWEIIAASPMKMIKPPKAERKIAAFYDDEQVIALLDSLNGLDESQFKYKVLVMLAIFMGARRGELMGLEWQDIDYEKRTISISRTSQYLPKKGVFTKTPKTELSNRTITIPDSIVALLKDYEQHQIYERERLANLWNPSDRLFTTWEGKPMNPDTITDWFGKFIKRHNLPPVTFHGLRHTNVSLLIADGIDVRTIATRVGHANPTTTLNLYSHMLRKSDQIAADSIEKRIMGGKNERRQNSDL